MQVFDEFFEKIEFLFYKKSPRRVIFFVFRTIHGRFLSIDAKFPIISVHLKSIIVFINYCYISSYKSITRATI